LDTTNVISLISEVFGFISNSSAAFEVTYKISESSVQKSAGAQRDLTLLAHVTHLSADNWCYFNKSN